MARPNNHEARYKNVGRKTKITPEVLTKLEESAALDASVEEMCFYGAISTTTYYNYCKANPEFLDRIAELRQRPILKARTETIKGLDGDKHFSFNYLKSKRPQEFTSESIKIEHSGGVATGTEEELTAIKEFHEKLEKSRVNRSLKKAKEEGEL